METHKLELQNAIDYERELHIQERAAATIAKYKHDVQYFFDWLKGSGAEAITKDIVIAYKAALVERYAPESVNSMLAAVNGFLAFMGWHECRVKALKIQPNAYTDSDRELTREEYDRLVRAAKAKKDSRLAHLLQTICATGIRVSELPYITVEAVAKGRATVCNKGKTRVVFLTRLLCCRLKEYCKASRIRSGSVFVTSSGKPLNRSNIWAMMKALCTLAGVSARKVFPHNLRHLFARCFYKQEHDLDHLAAILGHSNINTTRVYTKTTGEEHRVQVERLALVR